jgi:NB-ARC domain
LDEKFIVPYERNKHFTGRQNALKNLRVKLMETGEKKWNHRVAIYGLGGMGKTQLVLEYVYLNKTNYERIYWVSGATEATLFSGCQEIATRTQCLPEDSNLKPSDGAKQVLAWLNKQENWLVVIDNLDDVAVIDGYLQIVSEPPNNHIIITTRNQHAENIPAEGFDIGEYDVNDATQLLLNRSQLGSVGKTQEAWVEATAIVKELGCLPLAIEQAAAYIREDSKDLFNFLPSYRKNRKKHHSRASTAIRMYYNESVATTWHLSFQRIEENNVDASKLLRLLAFLNPDGILVDFLQAGEGGLEYPMA